MTKAEKAERIEKANKSRILLEEVASKIKVLVSRSALAKIEIGELLIKHKKDIEHGNASYFYYDIGMKERTAQYYMQIAGNEEVQRLKSEGKLEGLNMSEILMLAGFKVNSIHKSNATPKPSLSYISEDGEFDYKNCKNTTIFKTQYKMLSDKVSELEAKLAKYEETTA